MFETLALRRYGRYNVLMGCPEITERGSVVEVEGRSSEDVESALRLFDAASRERRAHVNAFGASLLTAMVSSGLDLAPEPSLAQAKRLAISRARLLEAGVFTHATLGALRGAKSESSVRTWVGRRRNENALFIVKHEGRTIVPAFQLADAGQPRPELQPLIAALAGGGISGWEAWSWLCSPSSLLSGDVPERVAATNPLRALRAAQRHVAQLAPAV